MPSRKARRQENLHHPPDADPVAIIPHRPVPDVWDLGVLARSKLVVRASSNPAMPHRSAKADKTILSVPGKIRLADHACGVAAVALVPRGHPAPTDRGPRREPAVVMTYTRLPAHPNSG